MKPGAVAIDARMWDQAGIGRYTRELVEAMERALGTGSFRLLGRSRSDFIRTDAPIYSLAEQFEIPAKVRPAELLHVPNFNIPFLWRGKLVATVHDLTYLREPGAAKKPMAAVLFKAYLSRIVKKADAILTVSEFTRNDLLNFSPRLDRGRVFVTPEAASARFAPINNASALETARRWHGLEQPFVLSVGSLRPHKNLPNLIRAVGRLRLESGLDIALVLAGKRMPGYAELEDLLTRSRFVRVLENCSDEDLVQLYNLAEVFVLPSLREGFGLPLVEAMACGTPVCASDRTSIPEVLGGAGLLFDPGRVDAISDSIYNVLKNRDLRKKLSQNGLERSKHFNWQRTAGLTLEVYERVLASRV